MSVPVIVDVAGAQTDVSFTLAAELEHAYQELDECLHQLKAILGQPKLNRSELTTVRLRIAQLRLARGSLLNRIAQRIAGKTTKSEADLFQHLHSNHDLLLRAASAHTSIWTLEKIEAHWETYRSEARQLAESWKEKMIWEQEILLPLLARSG